MFSTVQSGGKLIADKILPHAAANVDATVVAARLQAEFVQAQFAAALLQTQELSQMLNKVATRTLGQFQATSGKMVGQFGKNS